MLLQKTEKKGITKVLYKSSNILASSYNPITLALEVIFKNGTRYRYKDVRATDYFRFEAAESQGKVLNSHIKGKFDFEKLDNVDPAVIAEAVNKADKENQANLFEECATRLATGLEKFEGNYDLKFVLTVRKLAQQTLDAVGYEEPVEA